MVYNQLAGAELTSAGNRIRCSRNCQHTFEEEYYMEDKQQIGLSDEVIIEIVHSIKEIIVELINRAFPRQPQIGQSESNE